MVMNLDHVSYHLVIPQLLNVHQSHKYTINFTIGSTLNFTYLLPSPLTKSNLIVFKISMIGSTFPTRCIAEQNLNRKELQTQVQSQSRLLLESLRAAVCVFLFSHVFTVQTPSYTFLLKLPCTHSLPSSHQIENNPKPASARLGVHGAGWMVGPP